MKLVLIFAFIFCIFYSSSSRAVTEMNFNFIYKKQIYGNAKQNSVRNRSYSGAMAFYIWKLTALEFNYSQSEQIITENTDANSGTLTIESAQNRLRTQVYGLGLRQALANFKSAIVPMISVGYAKQFVRGSTQYVLNNAGVTEILNVSDDRKRFDSVFGTFWLKIKLTKHSAITGSVKTVFRAFVWNEAKDNITYNAGFSWLF